GWNVAPRACAPSWLKATVAPGPARGRRWRYPGAGARRNSDARPEAGGTTTRTGRMCGVHEVDSFGVVVLVVALVGVAAVWSSRLSERLRVPAPAIFLLCAAAASDLWPRLAGIPVVTVERVVTVALAVILFDGGMHVGWRRLRSVAGATVLVGVVGTFLTAGATAVLAHVLFHLSWHTALLLGTALAPTDPAVVFS